MRYQVPPIVIPFLLFSSVAAYALFGPPTVGAGHPPASVLNSQPR